jgi:hypothetical protein
MNSEQQTGQKWVIDLLDDGEHHGDGGRDVRVLLTHSASHRGLGGTAVYYGGEQDAVTEDVDRDDLLLPRHTSHRLIAKVCRCYMTSVGAYGDCGLTTFVDLHELVGRLYADENEADSLIALIETTIRTFSTTDI